MDILFITAILGLTLFMILAVYDGVYLHLWKFELFQRKESANEHLMHTWRAILFPFILCLLLINEQEVGFWIGCVLFGIDLLILGLDAYVEEDSRSFMGGLPRWEYIVHLFANSLHFGSFLLLILTRIQFNGSTLFYSYSFLDGRYYPLVKMIGIQFIPGSILLAGVHVFLITTKGKRIWANLRKKVVCC